MTREDAIYELKNAAWLGTDHSRARTEEAVEIAIKALENIGHLTDRPCDVCEFHKENGCSQWTCVFSNGLFGGMA